jgi:CTD nuclear envelope phosphatase 1
MGGGGGLTGISLAGLFPGSSRRGGGGSRGEGHTVEVILGGRSTLYHVYKRPFVDHFLKKVSSRLTHAGKLVANVRARYDQVASWYTLVVFTASMQEYADPVIDWLDGGRGLFGKKLYREVSVSALSAVEKVC